MEPIVSSIIEAIGWSILHSLWQGAMIYFILIFSSIVGMKMSAIVKHNLAISALLLMFFYFCSTFFLVLKAPSEMTVATMDIEDHQAIYSQLNFNENGINLKIMTYLPIIACA